MEEWGKLCFRRSLFVHEGGGTPGHWLMVPGPWFFPGIPPGPVQSPAVGYPSQDRIGGTPPPPFQPGQGVPRCRQNGYLPPGQDRQKSKCLLRSGWYASCGFPQEDFLVIKSFIMHTLEVSTAEILIR